MASDKPATRPIAPSDSLAFTIGHDRVEGVVHAFYDQVRIHPTLAEPFNRVQDWPHHLEHLTHFWWTNLGGFRYRDDSYQVAQKHMEAGFTPELLADWLTLFETSLREKLPEILADLWLGRAKNIGRSLVMMHEHQNRTSKPK